jgi:Flp pilus assembly protein protease CpaA
MTISNKVILLYILDLILLRIVKSQNMSFVGYSEVGDEVYKHKGPWTYEK